MVVAEECVFDRTQASHAINLFDMHQKYADVLPVAEIVDYLEAARTLTAR
jgi:maleamate amidohydrolase